MKFGVFWSIICVAIAIGFSFWAMSQLPETGQVPVHWDINGVPDRYGDVSEAKFAILISPIVSVLTAILLGVMPLIDPLKKGIKHSEKAYGWVWAGTMVFLTAVTIFTGLMIVGGANDTAPKIDSLRLIFAAMSVLFILIGNLLPKTRPSFTFGIRTPWTLSSANTWEKTHKVGGVLFMMCGAVGLLLSLALPVKQSVPILVTLMILLPAFCIVYSYMAYRKADDKRDEAHVE